MSERRFDLLHLLLPIIRGVSPESLAPSQYARLPDWGSVGLVGFRFAHSYAASLGHASLIFFGVFVLVLIGELAKELQGEGYAVRLFLDGVMSSD